MSVLEWFFGEKETPEEKHARKMYQFKQELDRDNSLPFTPRDPVTGIVDVELEQMIAKQNGDVRRERESREFIERISRYDSEFLECVFFEYLLTFAMQQSYCEKIVIKRKVKGKEVVLLDLYLPHLSDWLDFRMDTFRNSPEYHGNMQDKLGETLFEYIHFYIYNHSVEACLKEDYPKRLSFNQDFSFECPIHARQLLDKVYQNTFWQEPAKPTLRKKVKVKGRYVYRQVMGRGGDSKLAVNN